MTITATWRVARLDHNGKPLPPLDYTDKEQALLNVNNLRNLGATAELQQWDQFNDQWKTTEQ
jgi:hypothetical protein